MVLGRHITVSDKSENLKVTSIKLSTYLRRVKGVGLKGLLPNDPK